jgi:anaerobic selenocysteine-containing dehydrogenase
MNRADIAALGLAEGERVALTTAIDDGRERRLDGLQIVPYDVPARCIVGYYPECNGLIPLTHHAIGSKVPAAKSIPVRIRKAT